MIRPIPDKYFEAVTQKFGVINPHYISGVHNGVDFACPIGTPVVAPCDGEIIQRFAYHPTMGNAIYFEFEWNGKTYYMRFLHLSVAFPPSSYKQGDIIGKTGNTGDSEGAHLHLDAWNRPIDTSLIHTKEGVEEYMLDPLIFFQEENV